MFFFDIDSVKIIFLVNFAHKLNQNKMYRIFRSVIGAGLIVVLTLFTSCEYSYSVKSIDGGRVAMTKEFDIPADGTETAAILKSYKAGLDSMMAPVVGHAARDLFNYRPESPMSNLMADLLFRNCEKFIGKKADVAVMNIGGIRNVLSHGPITCGNIFEISPFENVLCIVEMDGRTLYELFTQIASVHGEGISGANLVISKDGKLISAKVGGEPIDLKKIYRVSTLDYVAEGNDKMVAFTKAKSKIFPNNSILRNLLLEYVKDCEKKGILVDAKVEGRIIVK